MEYDLIFATRDSLCREHSGHRIQRLPCRQNPLPRVFQTDFAALQTMPGMFSIMLIGTEHNLRHLLSGQAQRCAKLIHSFEGGVRKHTAKIK